MTDANTPRTQGEAEALLRDAKATLEWWTQGLAPVGDGLVIRNRTAAITGQIDAYLARPAAPAAPAQTGLREAGWQKKSWWGDEGGHRADFEVDETGRLRITVSTAHQPPSVVTLANWRSQQLWSWLIDVFPDARSVWGQRITEALRADDARPAAAASDAASARASSTATTNE